MTKTWYNIPNVIFIWNGTQSDPQLYYHDVLFNYYDIESALYNDFTELYLNNYKCFDDFMNDTNNHEYIYSYLNDCIFVGYNYYN